MYDEQKLQRQIATSLAELNVAMESLSKATDEAAGSFGRFGSYLMWLKEFGLIHEELEEPEFELTDYDKQILSVYRISAN